MRKLVMIDKHTNILKQNIFRIENIIKIQGHLQYYLHVYHNLRHMNLICTHILEKTVLINTDTLLDLNIKLNL